MIGALAHLHEFLQPFDRAEYAGDAPVTRRCIGVMRMAGQAHAVAFGHRHHTLEEIIDAFPVLVFGKNASQARRGIMIRLVPAPGFIERSAAATLHFRARNADEVEIVFRGRDSGPGDIFNHLADRIDLPVTIRPGQQDIGIRRLFDGPGRQRQLHHVEDKAKAFDLVTVAFKVLKSPARGCSGRISVDVFDAELRPNPEILVIARSNLGADIHRFSPLSMQVII
ncbi:hypothetical protein D3C78_1233400 [compost metagenome]